MIENIELRGTATGKMRALSEEGWTIIHPVGNINPAGFELHRTKIDLLLMSFNYDMSVLDVTHISG